MNWQKRFRTRLGYWVTLPERTLRALVGVAGGAALLLTETLLPQVLIDSTLYRILVGDGLRFIVEKFARVDRGDFRAQRQPLADDHHVRKMVGTAIEGVGLLAVHFSPLWVFAIAGDVAAGSKVFMQRLVENLKENHVLPQETEVTDLTELLDALQHASRLTAHFVDTPPLSRPEISSIADELKGSYAKVFSESSEWILNRFDALWDRMLRVSRQEGISLIEVGGMMAVEAARGNRRERRIVRAVKETGAALIDEKILDRYAYVLSEIEANGVRSYVRGNMQPYLTAAARQFEPETETWIERILKRLKRE